MSRSRPPRRAHRSRAHRAAAKGPAGPAPLDHPEVVAHDPELVADAEALTGLIDELASAGRFAFDTEFIRESSYRPRLCLIQVATEDRIALIDPFELDELAPFWALFARPEIEKIVHAGEQDMELVAEALGGPPEGVLDTQIAAGLSGLPYPLALTRLVTSLAGISLPKGATVTDWDTRPLAEWQKRYAADDVRYLPMLRSELGRRLEALGHEAWAAEASAESVAAARDRLKADPGAQLKGLAKSKPRERAAAVRLARLRDELARGENLPPRSVLRDDVLWAIARKRPADIDELAAIRHMPRDVARRFGAQLVDAVAHAEQDEAPAEGARAPEETPERRKAIDALAAAASAHCHGRGIDPGLVFTREDVRALYDGEDSSLARGWRRACVGEALEDLVAGRASLSLSWNEGGLRARAQ